MIVNPDATPDLFEIGDLVMYVPRHVESIGNPGCLLAQVTSVNDTYVFVDHKACDPTHVVHWNCRTQKARPAIKAPLKARREDDSSR